MTTPTLRGSITDDKPLLVCVRCERKRNQGGGVFSGERFMCSSCWRGRLNTQRCTGKPNGQRS